MQSSSANTHHSTFPYFKNLKPMSLYGPPLTQIQQQKNGQILQQDCFKNGLVDESKKMPIPTQFLELPKTLFNFYQSHRIRKPHYSQLFRIISDQVKQMLSSLKFLIQSSNLSVSTNFYHHHANILKMVLPKEIDNYLHSAKCQKQFYAEAMEAMYPTQNIINVNKRSTKGLSKWKKHFKDIANEKDRKSYKPSRQSFQFDFLPTPTINSTRLQQQFMNLNIKKTEQQLLSPQQSQQNQIEQQDEPSLIATVSTNLRQNVYGYEQPAAVYAKRGKKNILDQKLEFKLCEWIQSQFSFDRAPTLKQIAAKAKRLANTPKFRASPGWLNQLLQRHPQVRKFVAKRRDYGQIKNKKQSLRLQPTFINSIALPQSPQALYAQTFSDHQKFDQQQNLDVINNQQNQQNIACPFHINSLSPNIEQILMQQPQKFTQPQQVIHNEQQNNNKTVERTDIIEKVQKTENIRSRGKKGTVMRISSIKLQIDNELQLDQNIYENQKNVQKIKNDMIEQKQKQMEEQNMN